MAMASNGPTVTVNGCTITGVHQPSTTEYPKAVDIFYGVPFATAERFRVAVAACPEPGDRIDASEPGSVQPMAFSPHPTAENPLRLNIFRPASSSSPDGMDMDVDAEGQDKTKAKYPVVIYVHGGGFNFGHALERDLVSFVSWAKGDVLAVSISYRLGALGFPSGWEEDEEDSDGNDDDGDDEDDDEDEDDDDCDVREMNLGLKDQRLAVEWVREWVGAFGGDGENITMMGTSAGAHAIGHHILTPSSPLPFRKAILESGSPTARSVLSPHHPRPISQWQTFKLYACGGGGGGDQPTLNTLSVDALVEASTAVFANNMAAVTWPFQPVIDGPGGVIPDLPLKLWDDLISSSSSSSFSSSSSSSPPSRAKTLSVITGFCSHEGTTFAPQSASTSAEFRSFFSTLIPSLSPSDLDSLDILYPDPLIHPDASSSPYLQPPGIGGPNKRSYGAQFRRIHEAYAHYAYICPVLYTAHALSRAGARVYLYEYAALADPFRAASHGDQTPIVSRQMSILQSTPGLVAVAKEMHSRWTAFTTSSSGDLNLLEDDDDVAWPPFKSPFSDDGSNVTGPGVGDLLVFGDGNDEAAGGASLGTPVKTRTLTEAELRQCRFWWERMELSQGLGKPGVAQPFKSKS